jgi:hypothetical protein
MLLYVRAPPPPSIKLGGNPLPEIYVHKITNYLLFFKWGLTFLSPNGTRFSCCHFRSQKSLYFGALPFYIKALVMDIARIKIITFPAI